MIPLVMDDFKSREQMPPIHTGNYKEKIGKICEAIYAEKQSGCISLKNEKKDFRNRPESFRNRTWMHGMNHAYGASADKTEMINLIAQAVDIVCPVTAIQNRYSMMARWHEKLFPVLEELNIGFVAFSPLANGFLSGKLQCTICF